VQLDVGEVYVTIFKRQAVRKWLRRLSLGIDDTRVWGIHQAVYDGWVGMSFVGGDFGGDFSEEFHTDISLPKSVDALVTSTIESSE
jgi:hypothetical protein